MEPDEPEPCPCGDFCIHPDAPCPVRLYIERLRAALTEACSALDDAPGGVKLADRLRALTR